jgi:Flp pilus assembly protein TadD
MPMVSESIACARLEEMEKAENALEKALRIAPDNAAANFNMGLLHSEKNNPEGA